MHYTFVLAQNTASPDADDATLKDAKASKDSKAAKDAGATAKDAAPKDGDAKAASADQASETTATTKEDNASAWYNQGAMGMMNKGGFFMWPILLLGILATGVIIERYRSLKMLRTDDNALRDKVYDLLQDDKAEEALRHVDDEQGPVPAILGAGVRKYIVLKRLNHDSGRIEEQVLKSMEDYGVHIVAALERHLPVLATIASVAPMLGFLGTVAGMIQAFADMKAGLGKVNILELAAGGIEAALYTTAFGLVIGIPAFMAYNYFTGVINRFVLDVEETSTELIERVTLENAINDGAKRTND